MDSKDSRKDNRADKMQTLLEVAYIMSKQSTCVRANVGCVISHGTRVVSTGWNGAPAGLPHCPDPHVDIPCINACHAELNAIAWAARCGIATSGATLICTHQPCLTCAQLIINAGISVVYYHQSYRDNSGLDLLKRVSDLEVRQIWRASTDEKV